MLSPSISRRLVMHLQFDPGRAFLPRSSADDPLPAGSDSEESVSTQYRWLYLVLGLFLALGAPAGALILRVAGGSSIANELSSHTFFYLYTLIGTSIVFAAAGFGVGLTMDSVARERDLFLELSEHDELTGLLNARAFWHRYGRTIDKVTRYAEPLSLLMIDVDHLKDINDQEGHRFGSRVLQYVSRVINKTKRSDDIAARWGGDEFVILMPGASIDAAVRVAKSLVEGVRGDPVKTNRSERTVTVTIGVASAAPHQNAQGLFDRADAALYKGKRLQGNQLQIAENADTLVRVI